MCSAMYLSRKKKETQVVVWVCAHVQTACVGGCTVNTEYIKPTDCCEQ